VTLRGTAPGVVLNYEAYFPAERPVRARRHGFRARMATKDGRIIINRRRRLGRKKLTA